MYMYRAQRKEVTVAICMLSKSITYCNRIRCFFFPSFFRFLVVAVERKKNNKKKFAGLLPSRQLPARKKNKKRENKRRGLVCLWGNDEYTTATDAVNVDENVYGCLRCEPKKPPPAPPPTPVSRPALAVVVLVDVVVILLVKRVIIEGCVVCLRSSWRVRQSPTLQPGPGEIQTPLRIPAPSIWCCCTRSHVPRGRMIIASTTLNAPPAHGISFPTATGMVCDGRRSDSSLHLFFFV